MEVESGKTNSEMHKSKLEWMFLLKVKKRQLKIVLTKFLTELLPSCGGKVSINNTFIVNKYYFLCSSDVKYYDLNEKLCGKYYCCWTKLRFNKDRQPSVVYGMWLCLSDLNDNGSFNVCVFVWVTLCEHL